MQLGPRSPLLPDTFQDAACTRRGRCRARKSPDSAGPAAIPILAVTRQCQSYQELQEIFKAGDWSLYTKGAVELRQVGSSPGIHASLQADLFPVVIIDTDGVEERWQDLASCSVRLRRPPAVILTSRFADDRLWAEAFHLGVFDVLSKPFQQDQVVRTVGLAWLHWRDQAYLQAGAERQASTDRALRATQG